MSGVPANKTHRGKRETSKSLSSFIDYDFLIKVVVVGDSGAGKSQLVARFARNQFSAKSRQTIGVEFATKTVTVDEKRICTQLWDTAGEERYRALASAYYRGAVGVLLVFDVTNSRSFKNVAHWLSEVKAYTPPSCQCTLVGNKIDLKTGGARKVSEQAARAFAATNQLRYVETSALEATNVDVAFTGVIDDVYRLTIGGAGGGARLSTRHLTYGAHRVDARTLHVTDVGDRVHVKCCGGSVASR